MVHYESKVMVGIGRWANYDELEESLTLDELFELYDEAIHREVRMYQAMMRAQGAEVDIDFGTPGHYNKHVEEGESALERVMREAAERKGAKYEDGVARQFSDMPLGYKG